VTFLRRHLVALVLGLAVILSARTALPALTDAVTGAPAGNAQLARPVLYVALAPLSNTLDALTFLSLDRARDLAATWIVFLALLGLLLPGTRRRRVVRALAGVAGFLAIVTAAVLLPRPVPRLVAESGDVTVLDFHAHTAASHDGRRGWTVERLAAWHAAQGFQATYVTDHNIPFTGSGSTVIPVLPGVEWSVYRQHIVALGATEPLDLAPFSRDTPGMLGLFAALHARGDLGIASLPEYWKNHWTDLDAFVAAGVDGFEIVNCAPKALAFPSSDRRTVIDLARRHDLFVIGATDNHGWGRVTCVWNLSHEESHGFLDNSVIARPVALLQGDLPAWTAGATQPWLMFRALSLPERISWLTWILVISLYRALPRRRGQGAGIGILARSLWGAKPPAPAPPHRP
jgi:hypothetical protein